VVWVSEIRRLFLFKYVCGFFINAVVLFSRNDVTLGLCMLSFRRLLSFCDSTYWPLIIDVYTHYLIEDNCIRVCTSITNGQYLLSQKVNKLPNDNIHRLNVTSSRENKTMALMKNPQTELNRNCLLISGTHNTFYDYRQVSAFHRPRRPLGRVEV
jgi:hypothetical protein